ncbi:MAG: DUF6726 family protein [Candidatus Anammoxibacter sp.]
MKFVTLLFVLLLAGQLAGCFASKAVTVPMRVGGAAISVVPVVGNAADRTIDAVADVIE